MLKIVRLTFALAVAGIVIPFFAQAQSKDGFVYAGAEESGAQLQQYRYFKNEEKESHPAWLAPTASAKAPASLAANGGFTYRGDGTGWEVSPHKYVFSAGRLVMSDECDHAVRLVQGPTREEIDSARIQSPGA